MSEVKNINEIIYRKWVNENCGCIFEGFPVYDTTITNIEDYINITSCYWTYNCMMETMKFHQHADKSKCEFCKNK